nr:hypothetical protein [Bartonella queenslandensis]
MSFTIFTQLFDNIDQIAQTYVTSISSNAIATITPFVSIGITIAFILLLTTVFNLMMNIFANYLGDMKLDYNQNVAAMFGGALILSIISIMLLLKLSSMVNSLAKGMTFGHLWKHRN